MNPADGPYVGLDCFREEDAGLFFGRDAERTRIIGNLRASRLTLLHAESGVGKSSLLRAGVCARLGELTPRGGDGRRTARYLPVVFSGWGPSPMPALIASLEAAARPLLGAGDELASRRDALGHAIEDVCGAADATLLVILDQFEEHFLYASQDEDAFDDELAGCIVDRELRAHFLISVREDAYALIGQRFKALIPNVYGNYLHLDFLDEQSARRAVVEPVAAFNVRLPEGEAPWEVEPALVDAVLTEVRRGQVAIGDDAPADAAAGEVVRVETAYLQLVMKRIWDEERAAGSRRLRRETLRRLGGADTIVRAHLDDAMAGMTSTQRDAAAQALRFLVTSGGRKIALSSRELAEFTEVPAERLEPALDQLERVRILRPIASAEPGGAVRRELYHDVLAPAVLDWRRRHVEEGLRDRSRLLELRNRRLAAAVIALAAAIAGLGLYTWNPSWLRRLELKTVDARFAVRGGRAPDPRLALIAVDDTTLRRETGGTAGLLPRADYARILERVRRDGPAVIALDVLFRQPRDAQGDRALQAAIRATHDRLVLPYVKDNFVVRREADGDPTVRAVLFGRTQAAQTRTGFAGLPDDEDGVVRRANYVVDIGSRRAVDVSTPTFAFAAADLARHGALRGRLEPLSGASRRAWGAQSDRTTWIDYRDPTNAGQRTSALDVLRGRVRPGAFRDKLVVIGVTATGSPDVLPTPRAARVSGVEIQAAAIATMFRNAPLRDTSQVADVLAIVLVAGLGAAAAIGRLRVSVVAVALVAVAFLAAAQVVFVENRVLAVAAPLFALALSILGVVALHAVRAARARSGRAS